MVGGGWDTGMAVSPRGQFAAVVSLGVQYNDILEIKWHFLYKKFIENAV